VRAAAGGGAGWLPGWLRLLLLRLAVRAAACCAGGRAASWGWQRGGGNGSCSAGWAAVGIMDGCSLCVCSSVLEVLLFVCSGVLGGALLGRLPRHRLQQGSHRAWSHKQSLLSPLLLPPLVLPALPAGNADLRNHLEARFGPGAATANERSKLAVDVSTPCPAQPGLARPEWQPDSCLIHVMHLLRVAIWFPRCLPAGAFSTATVLLSCTAAGVCAAGAQVHGCLLHAPRRQGGCNCLLSR
jgi:hypothetical protein